MTAFLNSYEGGIRYESVSCVPVTLNGHEYFCYDAKVEEMGMYQLFAMRQVGEKLCVLILTSSSQENADAMLALIDDTAKVFHINYGAKAEKIEYQRGTWKKGYVVRGTPKGPTYASEFSGIKFQLPGTGSWVYSDDAELAELSGIAYKEGMDLEAEFRENRSAFYEAAAYDQYSYNNLWIYYSNVGDDAALLPLEFHADLWEKNFIAYIEQNGGTPEKLGLAEERLGGQDYLSVTVRDADDREIRKCLLRAHGDWIICIEILAESQMRLDAIQSWFLSLEEE